MQLHNPETRLHNLANLCLELFSAPRCEQVDEEQRPMNYCQAFQLLQDDAGSYFVYNDVFKLVYG